MRTFRLFCLISVVYTFCFGSHFGHAAGISELRQSEVYLDKALGQGFGFSKARSVTYRVLIQVQGYLNFSLVSEIDYPLVHRILVKAQSLGGGKPSSWNTSFSNLISRIAAFKFQPTTSEEYLLKQRLENAAISGEVHRLLSQIKTEELSQIRNTLFESGNEEDKSPGQTLMKLASWLSTLKPARELSLTERTLLHQVVSECHTRSDKTSIDWKGPLKALRSELDPSWSFSSLIQTRKLRFPISSESLERRIHRLLGTGPQFTTALMNLNEPGLRQKVLDLLPEDEARSKAQISRDWRSMVHEHEGRKGYPSSYIPQDRAIFRRSLDQTSLSEDEKILAIHSGDSYGFGEYRAFLNSIYRACLSRGVFPLLNDTEERRPSPLQVWVEELKILAPKLSIHSRLGQLVREIVSLENLEVVNLSEAGRHLLKEYEDLAERGNDYARQTIGWIQELDSMGSVEQSLLQTSNPLVAKTGPRSKSKEKWPESFPDISSYLKWKKAINLIFPEPFYGSYEQEAAHFRLFRNPYLRFVDPVLLAHIEIDRGSVPAYQTAFWYPNFGFLAAKGRLNTLGEHAHYYELMGRKAKAWTFPRGSFPTSKYELNQTFWEADFLSEKFCLREASTYAASGDPERAGLILLARLGQLEKIPSPVEDWRSIYKRKETLKKEIVFYDLMLATELSSESLLGKDEDTQRRILRHLRIDPKNIELGSFLKQKPYLAGANLLSDLHARGLYSSPVNRSRNISSIPLSPDQQIEKIHMFYWIGAGKEEAEFLKQSDREETDKKDDLSLLSSVKHLNQPKTLSEAPETIEARTLLQKFLEERPDRPDVRLLRMLATVGRLTDAGQWLHSYPPSSVDCEDLANLYSQLKEFKTALLYFENCEQENHKIFSDVVTRGQVWLTRYAQAYFETGDFQNALRILAHKERILMPVEGHLNFVDHELRIGALTELGEKKQLHEALLAKEDYERSILLPDLRRAAQIYEEDGDLSRAKQTLSRALDISKRLGDVNSTGDLQELRRLLLE